MHVSNMHHSPNPSISHIQDKIKHAMAVYSQNTERNSPTPAERITLPLGMFTCRRMLAQLKPDCALFSWRKQLSGFVVCLIGYTMMLHIVRERGSYARNRSHMQVLPIDTNEGVIGGFYWNDLYSNRLPSVTLCSYCGLNWVKGLIGVYPRDT